MENLLQLNLADSIHDGKSLTARSEHPTVTRPNERNRQLDHNPKQRPKN